MCRRTCMCTLDCLLLPSNQSLLVSNKMGVADYKIGQLRMEANSKQYMTLIAVYLTMHLPN